VGARENSRQPSEFGISDESSSTFHPAYRSHEHSVVAIEHREIGFVGNVHAA
jgi:hypothetical protein